MIRNWEVRDFLWKTDLKGHKSYRYMTYCLRFLCRLLTDGWHHTLLSHFSPPVHKHKYFHKGSFVAVMSHVGSQIANEATWRWCEPTCQNHDLEVGLDPDDLWPWFMLPLTHNITCTTWNHVFSMWWPWPMTLTFEVDLCSGKFSWS